MNATSACRKTACTRWWGSSDRGRPRGGRPRSASGLAGRDQLVDLAGLDLEDRDAARGDVTVLAERDRVPEQRGRHLDLRQVRSNLRPARLAVAARLRERHSDRVRGELA